MNAAGATHIRAFEATDGPSVLEVINDGARAYAGVIPADCWHEPYMPAAELAAEISDGVAFALAMQGAQVAGVMGVQDRGEVTLIRHAYVRTAAQGRGLGSALLAHCREQSPKPFLIGTWRAATWAIRFYEQRGFVQVTDEEKDALLRRYWRIPPRQVETSVVLRDR